MPQTSTPREARDVDQLLKTQKVEALPFRQIFDALATEIPFSEAVLVTTLPRGGLQIAQPPRVPETLIKAYSRQLHALDRPTWQSIAQQRTVRARECWPRAEFESSRYFTDFLQRHGFNGAAAAPLTAPVLDGYPGAIHLYRAADLPGFSDDELKQLAQTARRIDEALLRLRSSRREPPPAHAHVQRASERQFIFDSQLRLAHPPGQPDVDRKLLANMVEHAQFRFGHVNGKQVTSDRVSLPDSRGDLWNFRVVVHRSYPALGEGPFVFFCVQPDCTEWSVLRPGDFLADAELARLIPAMKFMRQEFHRGPTLHEIARIVHLSPFHFHRRFTEMLGITPKHYLLDCQIEHAKAELLANEKDLARIAKDCGFAHQSHFTSRFKQATGLTPTRWRKMATERQRAAGG